MISKGNLRMALSLTLTLIRIFVATPAVSSSRKTQRNLQDHYVPAFFLSDITESILKIPLSLRQILARTLLPI